MTTLPSLIGPLEIRPDAVFLWSSDASAWNPIVSAFQQEAPAAPTNGSTSIPEARAPLFPHIPVSLLPQNSPLPRAYILFRHTSHCSTCGSHSKWSQVYSYHGLKPRMGTGKMVMHLIPVRKFTFNVPLRIVDAASTRIPICHSCVESVDLSKLFDPRDTFEWRNPLKFNSASPPEPLKVKTPSTPKAPRRAYRVDDLF